MSYGSLRPSAAPAAGTGVGRAGFGGVRLTAEPAASDQSWDVLLACVAGYVLVAVGRVHQLFPVFEIVRPAALAGVLSIALYLVDRRDDRRLRLLWTSTTKWLIALLAWMLLSLPAAIVVGEGVDLVFGSFIKTVLMYFVLAGAIRGHRDVERLMAMYLLGATVYASVVLLRFDVGAGSDWRLGDLYYYDANDFATFAITAMPFGLYLAYRARRLRARLLAVGALAVLSAAFVRSGSRGGFLAFLAMGGFIALRYTAIPVRTRLAALAVVGLVLLATASDKYWGQMETIISDADYNRTEESGRLHIWQRGLGYMLEYPLLGVGPNNFGTAEGRLSPFADRQQFGVGVRWNAPHNSFIQVGAELGVPGLVLFMGMIASAFAALRRSARADRARSGPCPAPPELTQALTASLIGFVVGAFFLSLAYLEILYTLIALAVGVEKLGLPMVERGRERLATARLS